MSEENDLRRKFAAAGLLSSLAVPYIDFSFIPGILRSVILPLQLWLLVFSLIGCVGTGKFQEAFALKVPGWRTLLRLAGEGVAACIVLTLLMKQIMTLIPGIPYQNSIRLAQRCSIPRLMILWFSAVIAAPLVEELAFRHTLYRFFSDRTNFYLAALISSVVFTLLHGLIWQAIPLFLLSLFLQWVYCRRGSLCDSIIVHAVFNFCSFSGVILTRFFG